MDKAKLRSIIALHGETNVILAEAIGVSQQTFSAKINEKNGASFNQPEITKIKERYSLSAEDIDRIFFN